MNSLLTLLDGLTEMRRNLDLILYDFDDYIQLDTFDQDKFSQLQSTTKSFALLAIEVIRRIKIEAPSGSGPPTEISDEPPTPISKSPPMDDFRTIPTEFVKENLTGPLKFEAEEARVQNQGPPLTLPPIVLPPSRPLPPLPPAGKQTSPLTRPSKPGAIPVHRPSIGSNSQSPFSVQNAPAVHIGQLKHEETIRVAYVHDSQIDIIDGVEYASRPFPPTRPLTPPEVSSNATSPVTQSSKRVESKTQQHGSDQEAFVMNASKARIVNIPNTQPLSRQRDSIIPRTLAWAYDQAASSEQPERREKLSDNVETPIQYKGTATTAPPTTKTTATRSERSNSGFGSGSLSTEPVRPSIFSHTTTYSSSSGGGQSQDALFAEPHRHGPTVALANDGVATAKQPLGSVADFTRFPVTEDVASTHTTSATHTSSIASQREIDCTIGPKSSFYQRSGFCAGAKAFRTIGHKNAVKKIEHIKGTSIGSSDIFYDQIYAPAETASEAAAKCISCEYMQRFSDFSLDIDGERKLVPANDVCYDTR
jgi:hypothetical protein